MQKRNPKPIHQIKLQLVSVILIATLNQIDQFGKIYTNYTIILIER